ADLVKSGTQLPRALVAMENDPRMYQPRLPGAELLGVEAVPLQIARALVGKEDVGILEQAIELRAIVLGVIQERGTHPDLDVPGERLELAVRRPPDVEYVGPVQREVSADGTARDHMAHAESANAVQRALAIPLEGYRRAVADLLHRDQGHLGEDVGVLRLL